MSTMPDDEIDDRVRAGRQAIEMANEEADEDLEPRRVPPQVVVAGIGAALLGVGLIAWMIYRNRRRRSMVERWRGTLPGRVSDLRSLGMDRIGGLRDLGSERIGDLRDLGDELRARLKKAL
jgi:hypothetical protein